MVPYASWPDHPTSRVDHPVGAKERPGDTHGSFGMAGSSDLEGGSSGYTLKSNHQVFVSDFCVSHG
jgi:hypothetical protein